MYLKVPKDPHDLPADDEDLLAALTLPADQLREDPVGTLVTAYAQGVFPMVTPAEEVRELGLDWVGPDPILWYSPERRGVMPLTADRGFHVARRLADLLRRRPFTLTADLAFRDVMRQCSRPRKDDAGTWIDDRLVDAYAALHDAGLAHSIEVWAEFPAPAAPLPEDAVIAEIPTLAGPRPMALVGGTYGVHLGAAFFAESKFHRADLGGSGASKVALVALVRHLRRRGFALCDTQMWNPHIAQFGCQEILREEFLPRLRQALALRAPWSPFEPGPLWEGPD